MEHSSKKCLNCIPYPFHDGMLIEDVNHTKMNLVDAWICDPEQLVILRQVPFAPKKHVDVDADLMGSRSVRNRKRKAENHYGHVDLNVLSLTSGFWKMLERICVFSWEQEVPSQIRLPNVNMDDDDDEMFHDNSHQDDSLHLIWTAAWDKRMFWIFDMDKL
jgi:hypothetical protein